MNEGDGESEMCSDMSEWKGKEMEMDGGSLSLGEIGRASCRERVFNWV